MKARALEALQDFILGAELPLASSEAAIADLDESVVCYLSNVNSRGGLSYETGQV